MCSHAVRNRPSRSRVRALVGHRNEAYEKRLHMSTATRSLSRLTSPRARPESLVGDFDLAEGLPVFAEWVYVRSHIQLGHCHSLLERVQSGRTVCGNGVGTGWGRGGDGLQWRRVIQWRRDAMEM